MATDWRTGTVVCEFCGAVQTLRPLADATNEWRVFADDDASTRNAKQRGEVMRPADYLLSNLERARSLAMASDTTDHAES